MSAEAIGEDSWRDDKKKEEIEKEQRGKKEIETAELLKRCGRDNAPMKKRKFSAKEGGQGKIWAAGKALRGSGASGSDWNCSGENHLNMGKKQSILKKLWKGG